MLKPQESAATEDDGLHDGPVEAAEAAAELTMQQQAEAQAKELTRDKQWPVTVTLDYPVEWAGSTVTQLTFRRGRMQDIKGMEVSGIPPTDKLMLIASRMCGQPIGLIEKLDMDDAAEVVGIAIHFFSRCLPGGKKRSR